jgi:hypothetical protein
MTKSSRGAEENSCIFRAEHCLGALKFCRNSLGALKFCQSSLGAIKFCRSSLGALKSLESRLKNTHYQTPLKTQEFSSSPTPAAICSASFFNGKSLYIIDAFLFPNNDPPITLYNRSISISKQWSANDMEKSMGAGVLYFLTPIWEWCSPLMKYLCRHSAIKAKLCSLSWHVVKGNVDIWKIKIQISRTVVFLEASLSDFFTIFANTLIQKFLN